MYSAVSVGGKRLYELARKGLEVERQARPVTVSALELLSYDAQSREGRLRVACSKGTYIRVLIEDIAKAAGSCGTMTALRRVRAGCSAGASALGSAGLRRGAGFFSGARPGQLRSSARPER